MDGRCFYLLTGIAAVVILSGLYVSNFTSVVLPGNGIRSQLLGHRYQAATPQASIGRIMDELTQLTQSAPGMQHVRLIESINNSLGQLREMWTSTKVTQAVNKKIDKVIAKTQAHVEVLRNGSVGYHDRIQLCPEIWRGIYKGYKTSNCSMRVSPIPSILSVLLNFVQYPEPRTSKIVLDGLRAVHPNIPLIVAWPEGQKDLFTTDHSGVTLLPVKAGEDASNVWNGLVSSAKTPYVLVGKDLIYYDSDTYIERLFRVMKTSSAASMIGGAIRTPNGHWVIGCEQSSLMNYTLSYRSGYYRSQHECVYCDHIAGPFIAKREHLNFTPNLADDTATFASLFLDLKDRGVKSQVCPDGMFHVRDLYNASQNAKFWQPLAKYQKVQTVIVNGKEFEYTCGQVGIRCGRPTGIGLAPGCMQQLADEVAFLMNTCEEKNMYCDLRSGTLMGAVKMSGILPWELDADFYITWSNFTDILKMKSWFRARGWSVVKKSQNGIDFRKRWSTWRTECYGTTDDNPVSSTHPRYFTSKGMKPTRVNIAGHWLVAPHNPGWLMRREYGPEIYRHSQHNMVFGKRPMAVYKPRKFTKCRRKHSACLDKYCLDGNIQFERNFVHQNKVEC